MKVLRVFTGRFSLSITSARYGWERVSSARILLSASTSNILSNRSMAATVKSITFFSEVAQITLRVSARKHSLEVLFLHVRQRTDVKYCLKNQVREFEENN